MRAMIVLALAASPLALAAPADAQSVIRDGKWVSGQPTPAPAPPPPPPPPVEQVAPIAPAPATVPDAPIAAPPAAAAPQFAPRAEVVQPLPPAPKPPVARTAVAPPPAPAVGEAGAMPSPPPTAPAAPVARAEAPPPPPPGATYAPPAKPLPPVRRADAPPPLPKVQRAPEGRADAPPPPPRAHHQPEHRADARPMPHHARVDHADAGPHRAPRHRWGGDRDGRWEGGWNAPGGWGAYRRPAHGWSLPRYWWSPEFVVVDYWTYDLAPPMRDDRWVRYYDDAVLVDRHGRVIDWVEGIDWNDGTGHYYADDRSGYDDYAEGYGPDYAAPGYPPGGYISGGYYYPPAVTHTIRIESEPVVTSRTYVTEEVVTTHGKGGKSYSRAQTKKCNC